MASRFNGALTLLLAIGAVAMIGSSLPVGCASPANTCQLNSDCSQAYCLNGKCTQNCVDSTLDCPEGYICNQIAQCEQSDTGGGGPGGTTTVTTTSSQGTGGNGGAPASSTTASTTTATTTTSTTNTVSTTTATTVSVTASVSSTSGGPMGTSHELDLCSLDSDCVSPLLCRAMTVNGAMRCTRLCSKNIDCVSGTVCELIQGMQLCAGDDVGRDCSGSSQCNFACITGPGYCTVACASGSDCPNGYGCMPVGSPAIDVCVKAEADCSQADTSKCIAAAACDTGPNMVVGGCTLACNTVNDCPRRAAGLTPWSCDGLCRRPADVYGPLPNGYTPAQYACNAQSQPVNVCNDAEHIDFEQFSIPAPPAVNCASPTTTDGTPGDACVDSCRYQGGCPFGYGCTAVGNIAGGRVGLCLPTGSGEVGTACSADGDCAFAYCASNKCSRDCTQDGVCPSGSSCVAGSPPAVEGVPFRRCQ